MRKYIFRDVPSIIGYSIVFLLLVFMIVGPFIGQGDAYEIGLSEKLAPPTSSHWLGTDELGRDISQGWLWGHGILLESHLLL